MPEENQSKEPQLYRLAKALLACRSLNDVFGTAAEQIARSLQARNVVLWRLQREDATLAPATALLEDKSIKTRNVPLGADFLGESFRSGKPRTLSAETARQPNKHLQLKEFVPTSILCVPFKGPAEMEGVLELINKTGASAFTEDDADFAVKALELVTAAAVLRKASDDQSRNQLHAITRLTVLYDIAQIFNSTLELDQLLPIICDKIRDILEADTCTVWLLDTSGEAFACGHSSGTYSELFTPFQSQLDDDVAGDVIRNEQGFLPETEAELARIQERFENAADAPVHTYMATPLQSQGSILGAVEVLNRTVETPYNEEDLFLLNDLAKQAAVAIHNANRLDAERKAKELDALLEVSRQITSTLDLDRILLTIVNQAVNLVPYDRAAMALTDRNKVRIAALSGKMEVDQKSDETRVLHEILTWCAHLDKGLYISEFQGKISTDREENAEKFKAFFEKTGFKSFVSLPLKDEEGTLGILSFESSTPYFLDERHLEILTILANQATVAIRNAQLYRQVPLINLMEPLMARKARFMKMPQSRKIAWAAGAALLLLILIFVPWNMKIDGEVTVLPALRTPVITEVEGIVKKVYAREGTAVKKGTVLASLEDSEYRLALQEQEARRDLLEKEISRSESLADSSALRLGQIQLQQTLREIDYSRELLSRTQVVAPVDGVLITPRMEEKVSSFAKKGEPFCELADMRSPRAEVDVDEDNMAYLREGQKVRLKMNAFPTMKFYGAVARLGARVFDQGTARYYRIEARVDNPGMLLKSGMVGKAKVEVGSHSIGYVLLRKPFRFIWKKLWVWLP
jgi:RND family efflux transporter MFP subunit